MTLLKAEYLHYPQCLLSSSLGIVLVFLAYTSTMVSLWLVEVSSPERQTIFDLLHVALVVLNSW